MLEPGFENEYFLRTDPVFGRSSGGAHTMSSDAQLSDLLMRWEELRQQGKSVAAEDLCADTPELRDELCRRIEALKALDQVLAITPQPRNSAVTCEQAAPPAPRELPAIPGYEILGQLGHGGMGVVYQVRNLGIGRVEALKMMLSPKPHMIERFRQEIRAIAQFEHQRVVRIYAAGPADGQPYFTMEYIGRGSLSAHLERFKADRRAAVGLLAKVAQAVHFLHTKNIIHRDLKPGNILLRDQDEPLVSDFGLATFFEREIETDAPEPSGADSQLTRTGAVIGTTSYMSPEQAGGRTRELTAATDVWALGVILYELLTGRRPFVGKDEAAVRSAILNTEPASPRALQTKIDKGLEAICLKCLQKEPLGRYPSAEALANDLDRWLRGEPILPERLPRKVWRKIRRHYVFSGLILAIAVLCAMVPAVRYFTDPERRLEAMQAELKRGEAVRLIGATGGPRWQAWILEGTPGTDSEGCFTIHAGLVSLLELYPGDLPPHFRFKAEVKTDGDGDVGLFLGYVKHSFSKGDLHTFLELRFNDKKGTSMDLKLEPVLLSQQIGAKVNLRGAGITRKIDLAKRRLWHKLGVDVSQEKIEIDCDGVNLGGFSRKQRLDSARKLMMRKTIPALNSPEPFDLGNIHPDFGPHEALGLFVNNSSASFRNVVIEPLAEK
jgi:Protein kinase domain